MDHPVPPSFDPVEATVEAAGLRVEAREMAQLRRLVARRMPAAPEAVAAALCEVRRRGWTARLLDAANRAGRPWVRRADALAAAATLDRPEADDADLLRALEGVLAERLRAAGPTPERALDAVAAEAAEGGGGTLSAAAHAALAAEVASAHGLDAAAAARLAAEAARTRATRAREQRAAAEAARETRREEVRRLRAWETSLLDPAGAAAALGATEAELLRWAAAGLVPAARGASRRGGRERPEFDPAALAPLRAQVAGWRAGALPARGRTAARGVAREEARAPSPGNPRPDDAPTGPAAPALAGGNRAMNAAVARVAALDRYAAHFTTARALDRRITLVTGPTNSGKSHLALDRLAAADSGLALAPLRLLAHEFREALAARGVAASLSTGEERDRVPGSRHLAATVEMCPFRNPVDAAIIDEAQLLHDADRGAAWTAAIMGAPAREVLVLGSPDCVPVVRRVAALCGDPLSETSLERKGPLRASAAPVALSELRAGDALVAFSRREVLNLREALVARGRRVAVVYGALGPEVRRAEAARFRDGEAEILVATDAIGMGLNLPIRRVVFSALRKYDGEQERELRSSEVKQIGGRAGRYGRFEEGVVAVLAGAGSPTLLRSLLEAPPERHEELRPLVQPDADIVAAVAAEIGSDSLFGVLARIRRAVLRRDDPNYRLAEMGPQIAIASAVDGVAGMALLDRWTYAMCPADERDEGVGRVARWAVEHGAGRPVPPPACGRLPAPDRAAREELERAEKVSKRLVTWRWLSLRFPDAYPDREEAEAESDRLNGWIEEVLRTQRRARPEEGAPGRRKRR